MSEGLVRCPKCDRTIPQSLINHAICPACDPIAAQGFAVLRAMGESLKEFRVPFDDEPDDEKKTVH
jgi:hypothetical protein